MINRINLIIIVFLSLFYIPKGESEGDGTAIKVITAPEVKSIMETDKTAVLINALSKINFQMQSIPGSINIPLPDIKTSKLIPKNKKLPIIVYCLGLDCPVSKKAAVLLQKMGYSNIKWYRGGIHEWRSLQYKMIENRELLKIKVKKISPKKLVKLLKKEKPFIIDVRPNVWKTIYPYIEDAKRIQLYDLHRKYQDIPKTSNVVLIDVKMKQSVTAAKFLISKGYNVLGVLKGGVVRWTEEGMPTIPK